MDMAGIKEAFDKMEKKQKNAHTQTMDMLENMINELQKAKDAIESHSLAEASENLDSLSSEKDNLISNTFFELKARLSGFVPEADLSSLQKEVFAAANKCGKSLEKTFCQDISKACRSIEFEEKTLNQVIAQHLYREGMFELADSFLEEAGLIQDAQALKAPFAELHNILQQIQMGQFEAAIHWAASHRDAIIAQQHDGKPSLEFRLHSLQFLKLLRNHGQNVAVNYARANFEPFASHHMVDIQRLMCAMLWVNRTESSPYAYLFSSQHLASVVSDFSRQFCILVGHPSNPPLQTVLTAGSLALPTLIKIATIMIGKKLEWESITQLPAEVEIGKEFQFHSMFACPVSREQSTAENPPMLMPCGHVLCKQSILKLGKGNSRSFKCPYCPLETTFTLCKQIYF